MKVKFVFKTLTYIFVSLYRIHDFYIEFRCSKQIIFNQLTTLHNSNEKSIFCTIYPYLLT